MTISSDRLLPSTSRSDWARRHEAVPARLLRVDNRRMGCCAR